MNTNWSFGQKIAAGFAVTIAVVVGITFLAVQTLHAVVTEKDRVIDVASQVLIDGERLDTLAEAKSSAARGYLLSRDEEFARRVTDIRNEFRTALARLRDALPTPESRTQLDQVERTEAAHQEAVDRVINQRRGTATPEDVAKAFDAEVRPRREQLATELRTLLDRERADRDAAARAASATAERAATTLLVLGVLTVALAVSIAFVLSRSLARQIGGAVGEMQSSSTELQTAANQQASGAKEQATAMSEVSTTINELLATSRQIAESARSVAQIAVKTTTAATSGEATVTKGQESITGIRRQVELIVSHMLELGRKSQQVGVVLDIVAELAEQTNILAINATIEAVGAGEAGKRFAVVAEEIRKLADRVTTATKEIRVLIEDVRGAVNTTVMTTETGSKAVEAGAGRFDDVAVAFREISELIATTTEAAREIELSTKQQATAVEQVTTAVSNVAQATRESEASTGQTLQTASQLSSLSRNLLRLIQPRAAS